MKVKTGCLTAGAVVLTLSVIARALTSWSHVYWSLEAFSILVWKCIYIYIQMCVYIYLYIYIIVFRRWYIQLEFGRFLPQALFLLVRKCHAQMAEFAWASLRICTMCSADFLWNTYRSCGILQKRSRGICDPWDIAVAVWCAVLLKYVRMPLLSFQNFEQWPIP